MDEEETLRGTSFVKHAATYGVGTLSTHLAGLILLPLYTHNLTPSEYGMLQLVYRVGQVLSICLMANGILLATFNLYGHQPDIAKRKPIAATMSLFLAITMAASTVLVVTLAHPASRFLGVDEPWLLACGVFAIMLQGTTVIPLVLMQARFESRAYVIATSALFGCQIALTVLAVSILGLKVWGAIGALALTYGVFGSLLTVRELARSTFRPHRAMLREAVRFAGPFVPSGLFFFILNSGDQFFMMKYAGASALGVYALGYRIAGVTFTFASGPVKQVWNAWVYEAHKNPDSATILGVAITRMLGAYIAVGLGVFVFQREIVSVLGSDSYFGAAHILGPLIVAHYFLHASQLMDVAFYITRRTSLKPWIIGASTVVTLALYALLIPPHGAIGAAYATLLGFITHAAITTIVAQRVYSIELEWRRMVAHGLIALGIALGARLFTDGITSILARAGLWISWFVVLWNTHLISEVEKAFICKHVRQIHTHAVRRLRPSR